jgi:hypothetical protein
LQIHYAWLLNIHDGGERRRWTSKVPFIQQLIEESCPTKESEPVISPSSQMILDAGINVFALQLLSESLAGKKDIKTFRPISFEYRGVIYTLEPAQIPQKAS